MLVTPSSSTTVSAGCHAPASYVWVTNGDAVSSSMLPSPSQSQRYAATAPSSEDAEPSSVTDSGAAPTVTDTDRSATGASLLASVTAASTFTRPAPQSMTAQPGRGVAVSTSTRFTWSGVRPEFASSSRATTPATCGAAIEVPTIP